MILYMDEGNISGRHGHGRSSRVPANGSQLGSLGPTRRQAQVLEQSRLQPIVRLRRLEHFTISVIQPLRPANVGLLAAALYKDTTRRADRADRRPKIKSTTRYKCNLCQKSLSTKGTLKVHEKYHRGEKAHACRLCPKSFVVLTDLVRHTRSHTGEKPFNCPTCNKSFACSSGFKIHLRSHTGEKPYVCDQCPKSFAGRPNLISHKRVHSGQKNFSCTFCPKKYTGRGGLDRHLRLHTGEKPFTCPSCGQSFYTDYELKTHKTKYHLNGIVGPPSQREQECEICQKTFSNAVNLRTHKKSAHDQNQPAYSCQECGRKFKLLPYLRAHQTTHSTTKPEKCFFCSARFTSRLRLKLHVKKMHTREKPHSCPAPGCKSQFCSRTEMTMHYKQVHSRERNYECPECGHKFCMKGSLAQHIQCCHTRERPHPCPSCGKKFASSSKMTEHLRTHLGEKPYACSECAKRFTSSNFLKIHVAAVHDPGTGPVKQECDICHKFVNARYLRTHKKLHH